MTSRLRPDDGGDGGIFVRIVSLHPRYSFSIIGNISLVHALVGSFILLRIQLVIYLFIFFIATPFALSGEYSQVE